MELYFNLQSDFKTAKMIGSRRLREDDLVAEPMTATTPRRVLATRAALLAAARSVFVERGYEGAGVTEIVERSGTSTGSLYNRFGGKENLFLELHRQHSGYLWDAAHQAIDDARGQATDAGPLQVYLLGLRAFFQACWDERDLAGLFLEGDVPPGFDALALDGKRRWIDENRELLGLTDHPHGAELAAAVTGVVAAGVVRTVACRSRKEAEAVSDYFGELVTRLVRP